LGGARARHFRKWTVPDSAAAPRLGRARRARARGRRRVCARAAMRCWWWWCRRVPKAARTTEDSDCTLTSARYSVVESAGALANAVPVQRTETMSCGNFGRRSARVNTLQWLSSVRQMDERRGDDSGSGADSNGAERVGSSERDADGGGGQGAAGRGRGPGRTS
jgi:hypothetical protein